MISVCMATYNGEKYIKEQLDSILKQIGKDDEVLISDDGSTDQTMAIIKDFKDSRITLFENSFKDVVKNFEFVIKKAKGDYIFLSDQDDIWHDMKVEAYLKVFFENPKVRLVTSDVQFIDSQSNFLSKEFYSKGFSCDFFQNIVKNHFIGCAMAFRHSVVNYVLPFPKQVAMHDWWIGMCCIFKGEIVYLDRKLIYYRRHGKNVTQDGGGKFYCKVVWRLNLVWNLFRRYFKIKFT